MGRKRSSPVEQLSGWVRKQSVKVKILLAGVTALCALVALRMLINDHKYFFISSAITHAAGIVVLIYKLTTQKTCSGISLKSQILTAIFSAVRLLCSISTQDQVHRMIDLAAFVSTAWVIYMMCFKLKPTYIQEMDNMPLHYLLVPSAILALIIYPHTRYHYIFEISWAFAVYVESVSVLPQLLLMQNAKVIEPFTARYVFALGMSRFFACAHWIIRVYETGGRYLFFIGSGPLWFPMVLLAEVVQTFILADFCYYYIKGFMQGQLLLRMPV